MKKNIIKTTLLLTAFASYFANQAAVADPLMHYPNPNTIELKYPSYVEVGGEYFSLSNNQKDWSGEYLRSSIVAGSKNIWNFEVLNANRFDDKGLLGSVGNTHFWNEDWYSSVTVGAATEGFFFPVWRGDAFLYKRWLDNKSLVTNIGYGYYVSQASPYKDNTISFGATYYFDSPWIAEAGMRLNWSDPGNQFGPAEYASLTYGYNKKHLLTLRYDHANETYQIITGGQPIVDFDSNQYALIWRQWLNSRWGINVRAEYYENPNYNRTGGSFGLFREF